MTSRSIYGSAQVEKNVREKIKEFAETRQDIDEITKSRVLGWAEGYADALEKDRMRVEGEARDQTIRTIRHEGGHQLLFEFGIHAKDTRQGAWLVEGLATFCEPQEIGDVHEFRLMELKFNLEKYHLMPLEYLLSFAAGGDIHKLEPSYTSMAYAQSWAFVHFLMSGSYRNGFLTYVREVSKQGKDFDEKKDLDLLVKHLGKSIQELDKEFTIYVNKLIKEHIDPKRYEDFRFRMLMAL